jgi:hypothetical protein
MDGCKFYPLETISSGTACWVVPLPWLAFSAEHLMKQGKTEVCVWVRDNKTNEYLDVSRYSLFIEGADLSGKIALIEDIPTRP